jgi:acetyltransferase-like isoleucine patch superfamily enzyme
MKHDKHKRFHEFLPGSEIPGDWFSGRIPENIKVGKNCVIDSSFCFKHYFSKKPTGLLVGDNVTIWRASLAVEEGGQLEIGDYCYVSNASIVVSEFVKVGSFVFIAGGVTIADSDFHPVAPAKRIQDTIALSPVGDRSNRPNISAKKVVIGNDVWIGYNATILKGVTIGEGAVISPGSVVVNDVPSGKLVAGNPSQIIDESSKQ